MDNNGNTVTLSQHDAQQIRDVLRDAIQSQNVSPVICATPAYRAWNTIHNAIQSVQCDETITLDLFDAIMDMDATPA